MSTTTDAVPEQGIAPLREGDHLDRKTFHARYEAMPEHVRAELIGGVVHMASPLKAPHGEMHPYVNFWLVLYKMHTPGTSVLDNATTLLSEHGEPQPDNCLLILPSHGGQTTREDDYIKGAPELVVEVSDSSAPIDLKGKRLDYEQAGVREYVVVVLPEARVVWFVREGTDFVPLAPGADGIYRSPLFGGLWLDGAALLREDMLRVQEVLQHGLASPEHAAFVERLKQQRST